DDYQEPFTRCFSLTSKHPRRATKRSSVRGGFLRMGASPKADSRLSAEYPVNTTNGVPDARSFKATGSHVSPPRLTSRTAASHPDCAINLSAFATDVASPTTSKPALVSCWLMSSPTINSSSTTSTRTLTTLPLQHRRVVVFIVPEVRIH